MIVRLKAIGDKTGGPVLRQLIEQQIARADQAIVAEDFDTLMGIYTDDAVLVVEPGIHARGKVEIRQAFEKIARYFQNGLQVTQNGMAVLASGDTALVLANTVVSAPNHPATERRATYVFNRSARGEWLCAIDNSYGHDEVMAQAIQSSTLR